MGRHNATTEYRLIMAVVVAVCLLGAASSVSPAVDQIAGVGFAALLGLGLLAGLGYAGREIRRELLFRAEMHALDRRDAARHNGPAHPVAPSPGGGQR